jgi:hypothetical protein
MKTLLITLALLTSFLGHAKDQEFKLIGKALLEFSIFKYDIYEVSYYKSSDSEKMIFDYKTDVEKDYSRQGWEKGLEPIVEKYPEYKKKAKWFSKNTFDVVEGDKMIIIRKGNSLTMFKNKDKVTEVTDDIIAKIAFEPWIGFKPVDDDIKRKLLKGLDKK